MTDKSEREWAARRGVKLGEMAGVQAELSQEVSEMYLKLRKNEEGFEEGMDAIIGELRRARTAIRVMREELRDMGTGKG